MKDGKLSKHKKLNAPNLKALNKIDSPKASNNKDICTSSVSSMVAPKINDIQRQKIDNMRKNVKNMACQAEHE